MADTIATAYSTEIEETIAELFDGELVIANYGTGLYFSLSRSATAIWQGLQAGMTEQRIIAWLSAHCPEETGDIATSVPAFIADLVAADLIVAAERSQDGAAPPIEPGFEWRPPALERFEDLQELLLLDPVHDVREAGWPHRAGN